jgi:hypothetical protein
METHDDLQGLRPSQPDPGIAGPQFNTLEEMTAPVQFPLSPSGKAATGAAFATPVLLALSALKRELSGVETAACWISILAAVAGTLLILRQREQWPAQSLPLLQYRQALVREYLRQTAVVRRIGIPTVLLTYGWLAVHSFVSYLAGKWSWLDPASQLAFVIFLAAVLVWQKKLEARSVRRILRGA